MIACPICGARTSVTETRATAAGARRRRSCTITSCAGRLTTVEVVVSDARALAGGNVVVSAQQLKKLREIVAAIGGGV